MIISGAQQEVIELRNLLHFVPNKQEMLQRKENYNETEL